MANLNETIFQSFHWYYPSDGSFWNWLTQEAKTLKEIGFTYVWLPPAYKGLWGGGEVGYAVYDLYDLGEFDQKGSIRTKYGTKEEYETCLATLHAEGLKIMVDVVINHRLGGDEKEKVRVQSANPKNRNDNSGEILECEVGSKYTFTGRNGKYSTFVWDANCFSGIEDGRNGDYTQFFRILRENENGWDEILDTELGNWDYLLGADVNFRNPAVRRELKDWISWYYEVTKFDGIRLDAVKHMNIGFINEWLSHVKKIADRDQLFIGEYWSEKIDVLQKYIEYTQGQVQLIDVCLHRNFFIATDAGSLYDMRSLFDYTLLQKQPHKTITFVDSHDTQPLQTMDSSIEEWFQPLAYAVILLREQGIPVVFYPALYGAQYKDKKQNGVEHAIEMNPIPHVSEFVKIRRDLMHGLQRDWWDHPNVVGWTHEGVDDIPNSGFAVLLSNGDGGSKWMEIGQRHAGAKLVDILDQRKEEITIDANGWAEFKVNARSVSVWVYKTK